MSLLDTLERRRQAAADRGSDGDRADRGTDEVGAPATTPPIDPRIEARRREVLDAGDARRRRRWLAVAIATTVVALGFAVTRSALLDVDVIAVGGQQRTTVEEIRSASGIVPGEPLVGLDLAGAVQRIEQLPWVAEARVDRDWDGTVRVAVTERTPAAALPLSNEQWALVDTSRRVLAVVAAPYPGVTPIEGVAPLAPGATVDPAGQGAIDLSAALSPGLRSRVGVIRRLPDGELQLGLWPNGTVAVGAPRDLAAKVVALRTLFGQVDLAGICHVDVRVPDAPVLTRTNPCV